MAFSSKAMFEVTVSNSVRNQTQHVAGKFGTGTGSTFAGVDCDAGTLCVRNGLIPSEGYEDVVDSASNAKIINGNTWYFNAATNGTSGAMYGDHTGIYAFDNYDVNKGQVGAYSVNIGAKTLGVGLPANERGDFCEIIIGEQYTFGADNFTGAVGTNKFATIAGGKLTPAAAAPAAASGVYFEILRTKPVNEGTSFAGTGYVLCAKRTAEAAQA